MLAAEECRHFKLGVCDCDLSDYMADFILLGDASSSVLEENLAAYQSFFGDLADWIPSPSRIALVQFATDVLVHSALDAKLSGSQIADLVRSMDNTALSTSTYLRRAFDVVWDDVITPDMALNPARYSDSSYRPYMVVVSDGVPTTGQGLCENGQPRNSDLVSFKAAYNIIFITLGTFPRDRIECMGTILSFSSWSDSNILSSVISEVTETCSRYSSSPYNGGYSIDPDLPYRSHKPVYRNSENWIAYHNNEGWIFEDPSGNLKKQGELIGTNGRHPANGTDHVYFLSSRDRVNKPDQQICCLDSATPTRTPSQSPSTSIPSKTPSTTTPSRTPTTTAPSPADRKSVV